MTTPAASSQGKSGLRTLKPGEIIFNDGDAADSLYIIQKGQIRLFKPKGKGFIEIGVLRAGEVIGEMAFFDDDGSGKKRSCSAAALTQVEIIEISFVAFGKTMQTLNPWFKTIINTLATRLRKSNSRIKELEDNQASVSYTGKTAGYEFIKPVEIIRILGTIFLVFKSHGEVKSQALSISRKTLNLYTAEVYQIGEVKLETILNLLTQLDWIEVREDENTLPNVLLLKNVEIIRQLFIFYNSERHLPEDKKLCISEKCETLMAKMIELAPTNLLMDIPNLKGSDDAPIKFTKYYALNPVLEDLKSQNIILSSDHVSDGKNIGLFGEAVTHEGQTLVEVDFPKVQKMYPIIRFMNAVRKINREKSGD